MADLNGRYRGLRPIKPGEVRNPSGHNGTKNITELREFLDGKAEPSSSRSRRQNLWLALYTTAIDRRRRDHVAALRVLLAYDIGQPPQSVELSNPDGSLAPPAMVHLYLPQKGGGVPGLPPHAPSAPCAARPGATVHYYVPDNGRGPASLSSTSREPAVEESPHG